MWGPVPALRLALAQVNPTVGDLLGNAALIREWVSRAAATGADVVCFPEMVLTGYPIEDLALRPSFQSAAREVVAQLAQEIARDGSAHVVIIMGTLDTTSTGQPLNSAVVIHGGEVQATYAKHHLPNYGVFDEFRYFRRGTETLTLNVGGINVGVAICEDLWQDSEPQAWTDDLNLLLVLNGSPYERAKDDVRLDLCQRRSRESGCTLAYVNMVGGQDELVFDGDSLIVDADGTLLARAPQFQEHLLCIDLVFTDAQTSSTGDLKFEIPPRSPSLFPDPAQALTDNEEVYSALVLGLRDYVNKNGFASVILGLSGGIDSALVAAIACDALGPDRVFGVSMPSAYSSSHSRDDAEELARRCGLHFRTIPLEPFFDTFMAELTLSGLAEENLQARLRGITLMALSNAEGHLVLTTGNKSELAVGYSTIYGDAVGGFAPIKDVPKTLVWDLARWRNHVAGDRGETPPIPTSSIDKPPSAELRPDQLDSDSLPDYEVLDALLDSYVEGDRGAQELVTAGFDSDLVEHVLRLVDAAEYKRRQYPPGTKVTAKAFGRDRRLPITNRWREHHSRD